jgi:hypothetical protein
MPLVAYCMLYVTHNDCGVLGERAGRVGEAGEVLAEGGAGGDGGVSKALDIFREYLTGEKEIAGNIN